MKPFSHNSYLHLEECIKRFVHRKNAGALLLTGKWGVGKTFSSLKLLRDNEAERGEPFVYVSLYGLSKREQVLIRVVVGSSKKILPLIQKSKKVHIVYSAIKKPFLWFWNVLPKAFTQILQGFFTGGEGEPQIAARLLSLWQNISVASHIAIGPLTKGMIVVIDDLERRDSELSIQSVLGMINYLVETGGCKVIVIANDEELGDEKAAFDKQREKIFDLEIPYSPTVEENIEMVARDFVHVMRPPLQGLGVNNLRVMQRVADRLEDLREPLRVQCPISMDVLIRNAATLGVLYFGFRTEVDIDKRKSNTYVEMMKLMQDAKDQVTRSDELFQQSGFVEGPFDSDIVSFLKTGTIDPVLFIEKIQDNEKSVEALQITATINKAISSVYENFIANTDDVIEILVSNCEKHWEVLDANLLEMAGYILSKLGHPEYQDKWLHQWAKSRIPKMNIEEIEEIRVFQKQFPKSLLPLLANELESRTNTISLQNDLFNYFSNGFLTTDRIETLAKLPLSDYLLWLKTTDNSSVSYVARNVLKQFNGQEGAFGQIAKKTLAAMDELAVESPINQLRVSAFKTSMHDASLSKAG